MKINFVPYISSSASKEKRIGRAVTELVKLGFRNIELTGGSVFYENIESELIRLRQDYGLDYMVHNYFPPPKEEFVINLASRKPEIKKKVSALVKKAVRLLQVFGKNLYTVHPGLINEVFPELKGNFFIQDTSIVNSKMDFYRMLEFLSREIIPKNFKIGVENLSLKTPNDEFSFLCGRNAIEEFLAYFKKNKNIGVLLDLGHLDITSTILRFDRDVFLERITERYGEKIFAFHLSGNDGHNDSHILLAIDSWQLKFLKKHQKIFKNIPIVFEWHGAAGKETYELFQKISDVLNKN